MSINERPRLLWIVCGVLVAHLTGAACAEDVWTNVGTHPHAAKQAIEAGKAIRTLCAWHGKLYTGYGDYHANTGPIKITSFDPDTVAFQDEWTSQTEQISVFRPLLKRLFAPAIDPKWIYPWAAGYAVCEPNGKWSDNNVYMEHAFDMATLDGKEERLVDRQALLGYLDRIPRRIDASRMMDGMDHFQRAALQMITTAEARQAFDLNREPNSVRDRYGHHRWGQSALLARRLVEAGVTFVTINTAPDSLCWDWHLNIVNDNRPADGSLGPSRGMDLSGPPLDRAISALVTDLYERGLDRKVLLVVWGEFGRTPRINATGGRDHWGAVMSILVSGGGFKMGQVIGATNSKGEIPTDRPVSPTDVLTMMYRHLGIDPHQQTLTSSGRPIPILPDGQVIDELV